LTNNTPGVCANVVHGQDPGNDCDGNAKCDGHGACFSARLGDQCAKDVECVDGFCSTEEFVCCDSHCLGHCSACTGPGRGNAAPGVCTNIEPPYDPAQVCAGSASCDGHGDCFNQAIGEDCEHGYECVSGNCTLGQCMAPLPPKR
jgi:hypothetical protein